jgi:hypothetical protein
MKSELNLSGLVCIQAEEAADRLGPQSWIRWIRQATSYMTPSAPKMTQVKLVVSRTAVEGMLWLIQDDSSSVRISIFARLGCDEW